MSMGMLQAYMEDIARRRHAGSLAKEQRNEGIANSIAGALGSALAPVTGGASMLLGPASQAITGQMGSGGNNLQGIIGGLGGVGAGIANAMPAQQPAAQQAYMTQLRPSENMGLSLQQPQTTTQAPSLMGRGYWS